MDEDTYRIRRRMKGNPLFIGEEIIPFEIILSSNGVTIFEEEVIKRLNMSIDEGGYKFEDLHIKLGSKIHQKDFYYVEKMFQNSYYAVRFAYLITKHISRKIEFSVKDEVTILGYGLYSELIVSNIARFLNIKFNTNKFNHCFISDIDDPSALELPYLKQKIILIIPIVSTLTTQIKIYRRLKNTKKDFELILNPISVIVAGHRDVKDIMNDNGEIEDPVVKKFWKSIDPTNREITLAFSLNSSDDIAISKTKYFIYISSKWQLPHKCRYCWKEQKPLFFTNKFHLLPKTLFSLPHPKEHGRGSREIIFEPFPSQYHNDPYITPDMLKYGHYIRGENHYLFYIDTKLFFFKNKNTIKEWLKSAKFELKHNFKDFENKFALIIAPSHDANVDFVNLVNEVIFNDLAHTFYYDPLWEDAENLRIFLSRTYSADNTDSMDLVVFFVDDALCTGSTFFRTNTLIKSLGIEFTSLFILLNRLPYHINEALKKDINKVFTFSYLEAPEVTFSEDNCYLCRERERYKEILKFTAIDAVRKKILEKIDKLKHKNPKDPIIEDVYKQYRHFKKLEFTHKIYRNIHKFKESELEEFIETILNQADSKDEVNLVKTLSQPPFIYYEGIRKAIYPFIIRRFETLLENSNISLFQFYHLLAYIKRLAYLNASELLKREFLWKIKEKLDRNFEMLDKLHKENKRLNEEWKKIKEKKALTISSQTTGQLPLGKHNLKNLLKNFCRNFQIETPCLELLSKGELEEYDWEMINSGVETQNSLLREFSRFNIHYTLAVKETLVFDEAKSVRFEVELDNLLDEHPSGDFYDLLKLLYVENNVILKRAINLLTQTFGNLDKDNLDKDNFKDLREKIKEIPFQDKVKNFIKTNYRMTYLRYWINYKNKFRGRQLSEILEEWEDELTNQDFEVGFYKDVFAPLLSLSIFFKNIKENKLKSYSAENISEITNFILEFLTKIARIDKRNNSGAFFAIKRRFDTDVVSELYLIGKIGENSSNLPDCIDDKNSLTIKVFNGLKTGPDGFPWTNVEVCSEDDLHKYKELENIMLKDTFEYKIFPSSKFLFIIVRKAESSGIKPKGVIVFHKRDGHFSPEDQRYILLLRDELKDFLVKHYDNFSFEEWIRKEERLKSIRKNIEKFRHGEEKYIETLIYFIESPRFKMKDNMQKPEKQQCKMERFRRDALFIQSKFIMSKWAIGHYYAMFSQDGFNIKKVRENISNRPTLCDNFFSKLKENLKKMKFFSNSSKYPGDLFFPSLNNFDYEIDQRLLELNRRVKFNNNVFDTIVWELILNHLKHCQGGKLVIKHMPDLNGIGFISTCSEDTRINGKKEGFGLGINTIKNLVESLGGRFEVKEDTPKETYVQYQYRVLLMEVLQNE